MTSLWKKISDIGIRSNLPFSEKSRVRISNQMSVITSLITILYSIYDLIISTESRTFHQLISYNILTFGTALQCIPVLLLNKNGFHAAARFLSISIYSFILIFNSFALARPFHSELYYFGCAAFVFVIFKKMRVIIPLYLLQVAGYMLAAYFIIFNESAITSLNAALIIRIFIAFAFLFFLLFFLRQETTSYQEEIEIKNMQVSADHDKIQKINFTKDKIFSIISHDLRSPIGSLQALLGLLQRGQLSEAEFKKTTADLEKQVEQLKNSLDELLTWSKSQLHGINPVPEVLPLKPLIYEVVAVNLLTAFNKKITITTSVPSEIETYCDPNMLKSVMTNLITNAIKFTPVGGAISVSGRIESGLVKIGVADTGIGIPKDNMKKILNPSIHFTTRGTSNEKGTGLGLVMCREFIHKNNGTFDIESEDGKGSLFTITLPSGQ